MKGRRGVIVGPRVQVEHDSAIFNTTSRITAKHITIGGAVFDFSIPPSDLRRYVLYWDHIATPTVEFASGGGIGSSFEVFPEIKLLLQESILTVHTVTLPSMQGTVTQDDGSVEEVQDIYQMNAIYPDAQISLAQYLIDTSPELWALAQSGPQLQGLSGNSELSDAVEIEFYNALPVPSADVPIERVLEFKRQREAELLQLRATLDGLRANIVTAGGDRRATVSAFEQIDLALAQLHRVSKESFLEREVADAKLYLNLPKGTTVAVIAAAIGTQIGVSIPLAALVGIGINAAVTFVGKRIRKTIDLPKPASEFVYLYHANKKLGVDIDK